MTNEEKARKIIGGECNRQDCHECGGSLSIVEGCVEFRHLKEMAEWKDKQFKEYLEKCIKTCEKSEVPVTKLVFEAIIKDLGL